MSFRKIIGFGGNSYVVSLPKSWVEKNALKKGDLLAVKEGNDEIILSPHGEGKKEETKPIIINVENRPDDIIKSEIISAYLNNYNTVEIRYSDPKKDLTGIKGTIRNLTGFEIIMQSSEKIIARDLLDINQISVKTIIRRMDFITRGMIDDGIGCLDGNNLYKEINQRDADVNRLHFLAYRAIRGTMKDPAVRRSAGMDAWELFILRHMVTRIEKIADRQKRIARYLSKIMLTKKQNEGLKKIYCIMRDSYLEAMKAYYNKDKDIALKLEITNKDRINMCNKYLKEHSECFVHMDKKLIKEIEETGGRRFYTEVARIIENLKAMTSSIKYISRAIIGTD